MRFVVYNIKTTLYMPQKAGRRWLSNTYETMAAAKGALTRAVKDGRVKKRELYAISDVVYFVKNIEKKVVRKNLIGGGEMAPMSVNTPACCDPSTETYHCM